MNGKTDDKPSSATPEQVMARFGRIQRIFWLVITSAFCAMSLMRIVLVVRSPEFLWGDTSGWSLLAVPALEACWYAAGIWLSLTPQKRQLFILHVVASTLWILFLSQHVYKG